MVFGYTGKRYQVKFLGYARWFISIGITQLKDSSIPVDQARYNTSFVSKYLDNNTINENFKLYKTTLPHYIIFTKYYSSTSDEKVEVQHPLLILCGITNLSFIYKSVFVFCCQKLVKFS